MTHGTSYFVNFEAAIRYYRPYGYSLADISGKIAVGDIHIGRPPLKPGQRLTLVPGEGRYQVEERP